MWNKYSHKICTFMGYKLQFGTGFWIHCVFNFTFLKFIYSYYEDYYFTQYFINRYLLGHLDFLYMKNDCHGFAVIFWLEKCQFNFFTDFVLVTKHSLTKGCHRHCFSQIISEQYITRFCHYYHWRNCKIL